MRIIAGIYKGRKLNDFNTDSTRPTGDKARGAIFNVIGDLILNSTFLDLFTGTGAVGIEALSRGAKLVYGVDNNKKIIKSLNDNIKKININNFNVLNFDYTEALKYFNKLKLNFDIVYIDPPYKSNYGTIALDLLIKYNLVNENSLIIFEHDKELNKGTFNKYKILKQKNYGIAYVDFLEVENG